LAVGLRRSKLDAVRRVALRWAAAAAIAPALHLTSDRVEERAAHREARVLHPGADLAGERGERRAELRVVEADDSPEAAKSAADDEAVCERVAARLLVARDPGEIRRRVQAQAQQHVGRRVAHPDEVERRQVARDGAEGAAAPAGGGEDRVAAARREAAGQER